MTKQSNASITSVNKSSRNRAQLNQYLLNMSNKNSKSFSLGRKRFDFRRDDITKNGGIYLSDLRN